MNTQERTARVRALAKINLDLRVLNRRPDGFHELRTVFQTISLADTMEVGFRPGRRREVNVTCQPEIADNLVERAARLLMAETPLRGEVSIRVRKRIPIGAGLGGGSSDAAAVLLALPVLAGVEIAMETLLALAGELGSDVPFFLLGGRAVGLGRGTEVYPLPEDGRHWALVLAPGLGISTAEAYRALGRRLAYQPDPRAIREFQSWVWSQAVRGTGEQLAAGSNDFERVVLRKHPPLARLKRQLAAAADSVLLSGSGSAVFGLFTSRKEAEQASRAFDPQGFVVSLVSRAGYQKLWWRWLRNHVRGRQWPPRSRYLP